MVGNINVYIYRYMNMQAVNVKNKLLQQTGGKGSIVFEYSLL